MLRIDLETYSECDLKECGSWIYSRHPSTEILCMAWAIDDQPIQLWTQGDPLPDWAKDTSKIDAIEAHNCSFEISLWRNCGQVKYGFGEIPLYKWHDSMARVAQCALPLSLENAAEALHLHFKKDMQGSRIMMQLCKPRLPSKERPETRIIRGKYADWDAKYDHLFRYCKQDVEVQRAVSKRLPPLPKQERVYWLLTEMMNLRGIHVDVPLVKKASSLLMDYVAYSKGRITEITEGKLTTVNTVAKLVAYLAERGVTIPNPEVGVEPRRIPIDNVRSATLNELLDSGHLDNDTVAREVVQLRLSTGKSSTAKLSKFLSMADTDQRIRHNYVYHGATTARVAGRGAQTQNLPRGKFDGDYPEEMLQACDDVMRMSLTELINKYSTFKGVNGKDNPLTPLDVISSCVRGMITAAPGKKYIAADYSNIEGRLVAWVSGEEWKLQAFRDFDIGKGSDIYKLAYARAFGIDVSTVTKPQRQVGKVLELACGFGGSKGAFAKMGEIYGLVTSPEEALANVKAWRASHPNIVATWYALSDALMAARIKPNTWIVPEDGRGKCRFHYDANADFMIMELPSGRFLRYFQPRIEEKLNPHTLRNQKIVTVMGTNSLTKKWERYELNHLILTENLVQAAARDIMYYGALKATEAGYDLVMTIHDELVAEVPHDFGSVEEFEKLLCTLPDWAAGLPLASAGFEGKRYRK